MTPCRDLLKGEDGRKKLKKSDNQGENVTLELRYTVNLITFTMNTHHVPLRTIVAGTKPKAEESTRLTYTGFLILVLLQIEKRELKITLMNESRCDERLKARVQEATCLTYIGLHDKTN